MKSRILLIAALAALGSLSGCASYYKVTDPHNNAVYYTDKIDRQQSGVVVFKDAKTSNEITLPSSVIEKIPKEKYDAGLYATTPAPTTAPS
ncbi:MAG TPA: hypothetical protein VGI81_15020 [Tepidisphaeraceae bacterium]|jgi:uncharacterized protein YceK